MNMEARNERKSVFLNLFMCWTIPIFIKGLKKDLGSNDLNNYLESHDSEVLGNRLEACTGNQTISIVSALLKMFKYEMVFYGFLLLLSETIKLLNPLCLWKLLSDSGSSHSCLPVIILTLFINSFLNQVYTFGTLRLGMKMRVACCSLLYRKSLRLNQMSTKIDGANVINLLSNDVNRFDKIVTFSQYIWVVPIQIMILSVFLNNIVGSTGLFGVLFVLLFMPLQIFMGKKSAKYRFNIAKRTDKRISFLNETIRGMKSIKMYVWEEAFKKFVRHARKLEVEKIRKTSFIRGFHLSMTMVVSKLGVLLSTCLVFNENLDPSYAFLIVASLTVLRESVTVNLHRGIALISELAVSVKRINAFLNQEEIVRICQSESSNCVVLRNITIPWSPKNLVNCSFSFKELTVIGGKVGSGKSSLFRLILRDIPPASGEVLINGRISYAPQTPWLFPGSIRENILFGEKLDLIRYKQVINVCALEEDFLKLTEGDLTFIGENGSVLSGGQKARINLARAVYRQADVYLLDDPLSSVDGRVGKHIFLNCIKDFLKEKCVVLICNQQYYATQADRVFRMNNGQMNLCIDKLEIIEPMENNSKSVWSINKSNLQASTHLEPKPEGNIKNTNYLIYLKSGGLTYFFGIIVPLCVASQVCLSLSDLFLAHWSNGQRSQQIFYISTTALFTVIVFLRSSLFMDFCLKASNTIHDKMLTSVIGTDLNFFNNPSGRILNRFAKDVGAIDETLPQVFINTIQVGLNILGACLVLMSVKRIIIVLVFFVVLILYIIRYAYISTSTDIKRIEGISRSLIFTHVNTSRKGVDVIRAFEKEGFATRLFNRNQNIHSSAFYTFLSCNASFGFWLDISCVVFVSLVAVYFILLDPEESSANKGLAITQALSITGIFQWGMKQWCELENQMVSVERIIEYINLPKEEENLVSNCPVAWPSSGKLTFSSLSLQYANSNIIRDLNFEIQNGEKIGIVGRTGAGKTSLISALFRLTKTKGNIYFDNVPIKNISLKKLRSNISVIPQDPFVFMGTLRKNLDPFGNYKDAELIKALNSVQFIPSEVLDFMVSEGGLNLSMGQKQLIAFARAILVRNSLLILDEPTANVDNETEILIERTIKELLSATTVITIAHRLETLRNCDKILVLKGGTIQEVSSEKYTTNNSISCNQ